MNYNPNIEKENLNWVTDLHEKLQQKITLDENNVSLLYFCISLILFLFFQSGFRELIQKLEKNEQVLIAKKKRKMVSNFPFSLICIYFSLGINKAILLRS